MAGIEKICEFSGDYRGGVMYKYKHNHIQVMPKYRGHFHGKHHVLYIFNGISEYDYFREGMGKPRYEYILHVPDLPGRVDGLYYNWTYNLNQTLFNLWELTGRTELNVIHVGSTFNEYCIIYKNTLNESIKDEYKSRIGYTCKWE